MSASPLTAIALPAPSRNSPSVRQRPSFRRKVCATGAERACALSAMRGDAVGGRLCAPVQAVVADHAGDAQPVGGEYPAAALLLRLAVLLHVAPFRHARLVAPEL